MILASQSPRRIQLMREAGHDVRVMPADIDETPLPNESPKDLVKRLACDKAHAVAARYDCSDQTILAADTVVAQGDTILGKPGTEADARRMLSDLSGNTHQVATGVCILRNGIARSFVDITEVTFYKLTDAEIDAYIATGEPMDKAGAYGIQGMHGRMLVRCIDGDFYNVMGLPIAHVQRELQAMETAQDER